MKPQPKSLTTHYQDAMTDDVCSVLESLNYLEFPKIHG